MIIDFLFVIELGPGNQSFLNLFCSSHFQFIHIHQLFFSSNAYFSKIIWGLFLILFLYLIAGMKSVFLIFFALFIDLSSFIYSNTDFH